MAAPATRNPVGDFLSKADRVPRLVAMLSACLAGGLYLAFSYPAPDWLDGPELITAATRLGIFHPPGAPLAVLAGHALGTWPGSLPAQAMLAFSALWAAVAVYLLARLGQDIWARFGPRSEAPSLIAIPCLALSIGFAPAFLSQAVRCELYTLALALNLACLREMVALVLSKDRDRVPVTHHMDRACALIGMGLAVHPLMALSSAPALLLLALVDRDRSLWWSPRRLVQQAAFGLLGAAPLLLLPLMVHHWVDLRWGDPTSLAGWLAFVTGATFQHSFGPTAAGSSTGWGLAIVLLKGLGIPLALVCVSGVWLTVRRSWLLAAVLAGVVAANAMTLLLQRSFRFDNPDVTGYALPAIAAIGMFALVGLAVMARVLEDRHRVWAWVCAPIALVLAGWSVTANALESDRSGCTSGRTATIGTLAALPPDSVLLVADINLLFMADYLSRVEGVRRDLTLLHLRDLENSTLRRALAAEHPDLEAVLPGADDFDSRSLAAVGRVRPVAVDWGPHLTSSPEPPALEPAGLFWTLNRPGESSPNDPPPAAFFRTHPASCRPDGQLDPRFADVVAWHATWQALGSERMGRPAWARELIAIARRASPGDERIREVTERLGAPLTRDPWTGPPPSPIPLGGNRLPLSTSALALCGLLLFCGGLLTPHRSRHRAWLGWSAALAGFGLLMLAVGLG